jgi:hypothetical protein
MGGGYLGGNRGADQGHAQGGLPEAPQSAPESRRRADAGSGWVALWGCARNARKRLLRGLGRETGPTPLPAGPYPRRGRRRRGRGVRLPALAGHLRQCQTAPKGAGCAAPSGDSWRILDGFCESPAKPRPVWVFQIGAGGVTVGVGWSYRGGWVELPWGSHILAPDHAAPVLAGFRLNGYAIEAPS